MKDSLSVQEIKILRDVAQADVKSILDKLQEDTEMTFSVEIEHQDITMPSPKGFNHIRFKSWDVRISIEL